jgi:L-serine dehydratase
VKTSLFDLYKIGIGPSSSHTMGPMRAARRFAQSLQTSGHLDRVAAIRADLYGSLALTGHGHGTDRAVLLGLSGEEAATIDPATIDTKLAAIRASKMLPLLGSHAIPFSEPEDLLFHRDQMLPPGAKTQHPNGMRFTAFDQSGKILASEIHFSIGGGFIVADSEGASNPPIMATASLPYSFGSAAELLKIAAENNLAIWQIMLANECALRTEPEVRAGILHLWLVMQSCIERGIATEGILPGASKSAAAPPAYHSGCARKSAKAKLMTRSPRSTGSPSTPWPSTKRTPPEAASSPRPPTEPPESSPPSPATT